MAELYFRYSTMGAGKSLDLLKTAHNYEEKNKKIFLLTSDLDNRFGKKKITSRIGISREATTFTSETNLFDLINDNCENCSCVLIDESQFLSKNQVWQLTDVVDYLNCTVICYGLRSDYMGEPFEGSTYLMTLADKIEELSSVCEYGDKASMNMRLFNGEPIFVGEKIQIGGNDTYQPVCRKHFKYLKNKNYALR